MRRPALLLALSSLSLLVAVPPARAQSGPAPGSGQSALNTEMRLGELEDRIRELTGRIEELTNSLNQTKQQLDRLSSDVDVRFNQLQQQQQPPPVAATAPLPPAAATAQAAPPKLAQGAGADVSQPASRSGTLGVLPAPGAGAPIAQPAPAQQTASAEGTLPSGSAQDQYNYAMGLLTQANYPAAEQAMRNFVARWPKDPLAGNAQYWLGETFYVRKDYASAATAFAQGYEKYPKSSKAADDLLKLGMSLTNLNQKPDACRAFARLQRDFPTVSPPIKERLTSEKQRAGC